MSQKIALRLGLLALSAILSLSSCRCHMPRGVDKKSGTNDDSSLDENPYASKSQKISAEGIIPCHITDDKKIRCETRIKDYKYDDADLAILNEDDYKAIASNEVSILCGITTFGHLNCIGRELDEKRRAKKLADLFQSFNLDSFYLSSYAAIACGHDSDTDLLHCLPVPESTRFCANGRKSEFHDKAKDFSIGFNRLYIVNLRDEIEAIDMCSDERSLIFTDSEHKFAKLYLAPASMGVKLICGLTADHRAECRELKGSSGFADYLPVLQGNKWLSLSIGNVLICGILADTGRGHCIGNAVKPANYDEGVKLTDEELLDIQVGPHSIVWQTKAGVFSSSRYLINYKP